MGVKSPGRGAFPTGWCLWGEAHDKTPAGAENTVTLANLLHRQCILVWQDVVSNSLVRRRNGCGPLALFLPIMRDVTSLLFLMPLAHGICAPPYKHIFGFFLAHGPHLDKDPHPVGCAPL